MRMGVGRFEYWGCSIDCTMDSDSRCNNDCGGFG